MKTLKISLTMVASAWLLAACGGGDGSATPLATVSAVSTPQALSYGKQAVLKIVGTNLDQGITLSAPGCRTLSEQAGSSATARSYNCQVAVATQLQVSAANSAGTSLYSTTLPVPDPQVTVQTSLGSILLELNPARAAVTVDNFLKYTNDGFYTNLIFHRVIANFMVQGGGFMTGPTPKTASYAPIKLESNNALSNVRGSLAMARTAVADSATSQFYINAVDNTFLDYVSAAEPGYAVFGKVVDGLSVVDAIRAVPTGVRNGMADVPLSDVVIVSAVQTR